MSWLAYRHVWGISGYVGILETDRETVSLGLGLVSQGTVGRRVSLADALALADHLAMQAVTAEASGLPRATCEVSMPGAEVEIIVRATPEFFRELAEAIREVIAEAEAIREVIAEAEARTSEAAAEAEARTPELEVRT